MCLLLKFYWNISTFEFKIFLPILKKLANVTFQIHLYMNILKAILNISHSQKFSIILYNYFFHTVEYISYLSLLRNLYFLNTFKYLVCYKYNKYKYISISLEYLIFRHLVRLWFIAANKTLQKNPIVSQSLNVNAIAVALRICYYSILNTYI